MYKAQVSSRTMKRDKIRKDLTYWQDRLEDGPVFSSIPGDKPRSQDAKRMMEQFADRIPPGVASNIIAAAKQSDAAMYMILLSGVTWLLSYYGGTNDVVVTMPAFRNLRDDSIEVSLPCIPLRILVEGQLTYREWLMKNRSLVMEADEYKNIPFSMVLDLLGNDHKEGRPAWSTAVYLDGLHQPDYLTSVDSELVFGFQAEGDGISLCLSYNADIYSKAFMTQMMRHLWRFYEAALADPSAPIGQIEVIDDKDRQHLLYGYDKLMTPYPDHLTLHERFEEQVEACPDHIALSYDGRVMTYKELNERSNRLAWTLRAHGLVAEELVAVIMDRSENMIVAMMGILKAGGAYVPIDPDYPADRISYTLQDSGVSYLITEGNHLPQEIAFEGTIINLVAEEQLDTRCSNPPSTNTPDHLCYIIYTSGTTGNPKGVMIEHRNVIRLLFNDSFAFDFNSRDVWTLFHSICFDFSVWEMYGALLYGGKLVIVSKETAREPQQFIELVMKEQVTVLNQTPTAFYYFVEELKQSNSSCNHDFALRYVIFGGEALKPAMLEPFSQLYPATKLVNMYGITETTVHVTYKELTAADIANNASNIGEPIPTLAAYIMDEQGRLVPAGVVGELYVGGAGVGRGYLNKGELTAQRFVKHPYKPQERLYRTGDLAKIRLDGDMEYYGRIDHQVKIRGHRIELGEVEAVFMRHLSINEAFAVAANDAGGQTHICIYYASDEDIGSSNMRRYAAQYLPSYMVPSSMIRLDHIPLTSNGKVDRRKLPDPFTRSDEADSFTEPTNEKETILCGLYQHLFGLERVGITDSFFELGGDSIRALRLISSINEALGVQLQIKDLYMHPVICELAAHLGGDSLDEQNLRLKEASDELEKMKLAIINNPMLVTSLPKDWKDVFPMSDIQAGMIYDNLRHPEAANYHDQMPFPLDDKRFDAVRLQAALTGMTAKHDILRTVFDMQSFDQPMQIVLSEFKPKVEYVHLSGLEPTEQQERISAYMQEDRSRGFELHRPLWRTCIFQLNQQQYVLLFICHHAILDGWSVAAFATELMNAYFALKDRQGAGGSFKPLQSSYKTFVTDQLAIKKDPAIKAYWSAELDGYNRLQLPVREGKKPVRTEFYEYTLSSELSGELSALATRQRTSLKHICFALYTAVMSLMSRDNDILVGMVEHNRPASEDAEKMLGCFLNTLPVRLNIGVNDTWKDILNRTDVKLKELKHYGRLPLAEVMKVAGVVSGDGQPLFDTFFNYIDFHIYNHLDPKAAVQNDSGVQIEGYVRNDILLDFTVVHYKGDIKLSFMYRTSVFSQADMERLSENFERAAKLAVYEEHALFQKEALLAIVEAEMLLKMTAGSEIDQKDERTVVAMFEQQARLQPRNTAVVDGEHAITFAELNEEANKVARALRARHIGRSDRVALVFEAGTQLVTAMLAVLKIGAAFVPVDPSNPAERVSFVIKDSGSRAVLTSEGMLSGIDTNEMNVLDFTSLVTNHERINDECEQSIMTDVQPQLEDPAYIIYTSGTTGSPKGVVVKHGGLANYVNWFLRSSEAGSDDRTALLSSYSFDLGYTALFPALCGGSSLYMPSKEIYSDPEALLLFLEDKGITFTKLTPSLFGTLAQSHQLQSSHLDALRLIVIGGEAVQPSDVGRFHEIFPRVKFMNHYGPSETTIGCAAGYIPFDQWESFEGQPVLGTPIDHTRIYVLDANQQPLRAGVIGEMYIAGAGLAEGYLDKPDLTAERFIAAQVFGRSERLYRTGDLGSYTTAGAIVFHGRADGQVKIRGYRVEPSGIEAKLLTYEAIVEARVVPYPDKEDRVALTAYVVASESISMAQLRNWLAESLPDYMVPASFVLLERMPLTANGKLDRRALPAPDMSSVVNSTVYTPPRNELEKTLARIWKQVLGVQTPGIHDHFFELGGDSIKAIQVSSRLHAEGLRIELKNVLKHPTISGMSRHITKTDRTIEQGPVEGDITFTPIVKRFMEQPEEVRHHYNQSVMLHFRDGISADSVRRIFDELTRHHDALRIVLSSSLGEREVRLYNRGVGTDCSDFYRLIIRDLRHVDAPADEISKEANLLQEGISLSEGPFVQLGLFQTSQGDHLLIIIHHLVIDGVSWRILFEDILKLYEQITTHDALRLPKKTDSFLYWAEQLSAYSRSKPFTNQAAYWNALSNETFGKLTTDYESTDNKVRDTRAISVQFSEGTTMKLLKQSHHAYGTDTNDLLLGALGLACRDWCGMEWLLVELEGHGREDIGRDINISRTVGWFTAAYPVALETGGALNEGGHIELSTYVKRVKEQLGKIPDKGIGYGVLKYLTSASPMERQVALLPEPEISFNYLGQFDQDVETGVFSISSYVMGSPVHPDMNRRNKLDITGIITGGRLEIAVHYNKEEYEESTMQRFADFYTRRLEQLIDHCIAKETPEKTPSDYGSSLLSIAELELIEQRYPDMEQVYPLSPMQSGLLFHSMMNSESAAYFEQFSFVLKGKLDFEKFEQSFNEVLRRHDIFRTAFMYEGIAVPHQIVRRHQDNPIKLLDIRDMDAVEQSDYLGRAKQMDRVQGFELSEGRLMRMTLLRTYDDVYQVLWSHHHIVMDGWCMETITNDLLSVYGSLLINKPIMLEPAQPYANYIRWLENIDKPEGLTYWKGYLDGYTRQASLPRTRRNVGSYSKQEYVLTFDKEITDQLERLGRKQRVTLYTILQTMWGLILQRYNGTDDVVYGSVVSGRPPELSGIETMVGLFINTVPVRIQTKESQSFSALLEQIQEASIASKIHEFIPLAEIQGMSALKQDLVDTIIVYENYPVGQQMEQASGEDAIGLSITDVEVFEQTNYDLDLTIIPDECLQIKFTYNASVYDDSIIKQAARGLLQLAYQVTVNPGVQIEDIHVLDPAGRTEILHYSRGKRVSYSLEQPVYRLFEHQSVCHPEQTAVLFGKERTNYQSLNRSANRLAHYLMSLGTKKEELVAVLLDRSPRMMEAFLAIWKAGGAYVPIDPEYPVARQLTILQESGVKFVITYSSYAELLGQMDVLSDVKWVLLDQLAEELVKQKVDNVKREVSGSDLAYVIYTSGSTGTPKGTMIEHAGMLNHMLAEIDELEIAKGTVLAQNASHCFDVSVWQFFAALLVGGTTAIYPNELIMEPNRFIEQLGHDKVEVLEVVPSYLAVMMDVFETAGCRPEALRYLMITGETVKSAMVKRWFELCPNIPMINAYGPAEASDDVSQYVMTGLPDTEHIPVGKPIANMNLYVVDEQLRLSPIGAIGEICVSGIGVGRGYLNDSMRTEAAFMEDPFADESGIRLYRTGDLGRWLPGGTIEFFGRKDYQVKIRGFRIELGEIEAKLAAHKGVREAVVTDFVDNQGNQALCAYIELRDRSIEVEVLNVEALRSYLAQELPDYMIPAVIMYLDQMPLSPNGKVDRKALPVPDEELDMHYSDYEAPRNDIEHALCAVWSDVLGMESVGIRDHFFSIGGDSIKAIQVVSRLYNYGLKLEMRDLFQYPQIAQLSMYMKEAKEVIDQGPVHGEIRLTPIQQSFFEVGHAEPSHYNQSIMLYRAEGFNEQVLRNAWLEIVRHHDALRIVFRKESTGIKAYNRGIEKEDHEWFDMQVYEIVDDERQETTIHDLAETMQRSMNLEEGPLVKLGLFQTSKGDHLLIAIHHLVIDGVSWRILLEDLELTLKQQEQLAQIKLPHKTISYQRWSELLEAYGKGKEMQAEVAYWCEQDRFRLPELPRLTNLKKTRLLKDSSIIQHSLTTELTQSLLTSVHHAYNTELNDLLLAALADALTKWNGSTMNKIVMEGHGREELLPEMNVNRTVGWFTSEFPLLLEGQASESQAELGLRVRKMKEALRKIPNKGAGYGIYRQLCRNGTIEQKAYPTKPDIVFNYLGQFDNDLSTSMFEPSVYSGGHESSGENRSEYALDIAAVIENGRLQVAVTYNRNEFKEETVRTLADAYLQQLEVLILHCQQQTVTEQTPSDVGYDELSIEQFDELTAELADLLND
ncbi:non-ribosomal peptide synthetase [Paenibacillus assamensis]|uniref:non-ribosomal peptide synthetase n=1 Tax=Paenibacillus assamensis TaxID=311244 RepID=UPI00041232B4|nr:non-ribosomal peptide synthetase [Paenibacillus assamensis]